MYSLHLTCAPDDVDLLSAELWELGTAGIREETRSDNTFLIAAFDDNEQRLELMRRFEAYLPEWELEDAIDWVQYTHDAWPPREVGEHFFLAPPWSEEPTPFGRHRIVHNPGLACGTGEHPCTQLALEALEKSVMEGDTVADIGTGSGMLAIGAILLGATVAIGADLDEVALRAAQENFQANGLTGDLVAGSADALRSGCADVTVANISGTVLLSIADELIRITCSDGVLILTGFPEWEADALRSFWPHAKSTEEGEWRCFTVRLLGG